MAAGGICEIKLTNNYMGIILQVVTRTLIVVRLFLRVNPYFRFQRLPCVDGVATLFQGWVTLSKDAVRFSVICPLKIVSLM